MIIKNILYSLFFFVLFQANLMALCLTDKVHFGDSFSNVAKKLNAPAIHKPLLGMKEGKELPVPGHLVCKIEAFDGLPVTYVFIEDQLVQIKGIKIGIKELDVLDWLEKEFGIVEKKIENLNTAATAAEFYWDKEPLFIFYAMRRDDKETFQYMEITNKKYKNLFKDREE